jgi:hypothetical protein
MAPAPPLLLPRCFRLLSSGQWWTLICFLGCRHWLGNSDGITVTLMLVPGASGTPQQQCPNFHVISVILGLLKCSVGGLWVVCLGCYLL